MNGVGPSANATAKVGRNDPCPCGSGRKYKHCCQAKDASAEFAAGTAQGSPRSPAVRHRVQALFLAATRHWEAGRLDRGDFVVRGNHAARPEQSAGAPRPRPRSSALRLARGGGQPSAGTGAAAQPRQRARPSRDRPSPAGARARSPARLSQAWPQGRGSVQTAVLFRPGAGDGGQTGGSGEGASPSARPGAQTAPARALLGELLSNRGMFEEAARHLTQAVEAFPPAFQQLTSAKRMTEADRPLVERMRSLAERPGLDVLPRISIHFALGKAYDDLGDYAEAMRHYEEANRLRAMSARFDRPALAAKYDSLIAGFTAEALSARGKALARPAGPGDELPVFIVGMPRSGTHPGRADSVFASSRRGRGRTEFLVRSARRLGHGRRDWPGGGGRARQGCRKTIAPACAKSILAALRVTDKRPWNFELLWLIRLALPDARVIHCRRNPVDTCLSIFFANFGARLDYGCDRGDLVFFYRQYERLMATGEARCRPIASPKWSTRG